MSAEKIEVILEYDGRHVDVARLRRALFRRELNDDDREYYRRAITDGRFLTSDYYEPLPGPAAKRLRMRLLGTHRDKLPERGWMHGSGTGRDLISGLWRFGHIPMLSGQPRAGKSSFVAELVTSLVTPGRSFLGYYPPAELSLEEYRRGILLINAENPVAEQRAVLEAAGLEWQNDDAESPADDYVGPVWYFPESTTSPDHYVEVEHLEQIGGAAIFDLRKPELFDLWLDRLVDCSTCTGLDDRSPLVIVVDGLTAILGSDTAAYGQWYAAFRLLMREIDCENALVVTHSPLAGGGPMHGVESEAQADGTWILETTSRDPRAPRKFHGTRRLVEGGIEGGRIYLDDGRLKLVPKSANAATASTPEEPEIDRLEGEVLKRLAATGNAGLPATELTGRGRVGQQRRELLRQLEADGRIHSVTDGRGIRWHLGGQSGE